ncbi:DNA-directed RNA polymerase III subunit RPC6 [Cloeon dipterum]|uniref:DNA-directed RNA polymerase III subunit RPC6 n=1 Tax=Cloeon dipterum TaxID=197152 RepID=UPI00321F90AF
MDTAKVEAKILDVLKSAPNGIDEKARKQLFEDCDSSNILTIFNGLLAQGKIEILADEHKNLIYKLKEANLIPGLEKIEDQIVYDHIARSGDQGIWIRDIRTKTNLPNHTLNKILKQLESKKLVKSVKSVLAGKRKVYMLYDVEPDSRVTGGTFYQEQEFDVEFTDLLTQETLKFLTAKAESVAKMEIGPLEILTRSFVTISEILKFICRLQIFNVQIKENDIQKILQCLSFDGKIECSSKVEPSGVTVECFRAVAPLISTPSIVRMPCGACPLSEKCSLTGRITPSNCKYFTDWLHLDPNELM